MTWFEKVRKIVPTDQFSLAFVVVNSAQMAQALKDIENTTTKPTALKATLRSIQTGQLKPEKLLDSFKGDTNHVDQTLEQVIENIEKIKNAVSFLTTDEVRVLVKEALEAKSNNNPQKVKEILQRLEEEGDLSPRTLRRNRDIRDSMDILRMSGGKSVMMFKKPPENKKILEDFAKLIGGTVIGDSIEVPFKSQGEFIAMMAYKRKKSKNAQGKEVYIITDTPAEKAKKDEIKEFYNKHLRTSGWSLNIGDKHIELDDLVTRKKLFVSGNVQYSVVEPFSASSVLKYVGAVAKIKGSARAFKPKEFPNGEPVPNSLFLQASTSSPINLNPYGKIIMTNTYSSDKTWYKDFFDSLRASELLSEEDANALIIDDIYESLKTDATSSKEGISLTPFRGEDALPDINAVTKNAAKKKIRQILSGNERLSATVLERVVDKQSEQLQYLKEGVFTVREAIEFEKWWKSQGNDPDELKIGYFKDGKPTSRKDGRFQGFKTDDKGDFIRDSAGQLIPLTDDEGNPLTEADEGKSEANYAKVQIYDDFDEEWMPSTPNEAYQQGLKVKTKPSSEAAQEKTSESIGKIEEKLKNARLNNAKLPKTKQKNSKGKMVNYPLMREQNEVTIANLERDLAEAKARKENPSQGKDLSADIGKIRDELLAVDNFADYVVNMSIKLKDEGGLYNYVNTFDNKASALDTLSPKRSLNFIAQADELAGEDKVREAFKTIDSEQDLEKKKVMAEKLNAEMPKILTNIQTSLVSAFKSRLEYFCASPAQFPDTQVMSAIKEFTNKGLIKTGE